MKGYIGETIVDVKDTPYKDYTPADWAMYFIEHYGQIDGDHHKAWVLDQVARILKGTPIIVKLAEWKNGHKEYRIITGIPSTEYLSWGLDMMIDDDGNEYTYNQGIAP